MKEIRVSVTQLAEYVARTGDIAGGGYGSVSGTEGTRLHQRIFRDLGKDYEGILNTEYGLSSSYEDLMSGEYVLQVQGRADCLLSPDSDCPHIIEIKSFNSTKNSYERLMRTDHLTQLKLYGAMYLFSNDKIEHVKLTLRYVSITTLEYYEKTYTMEFEDAVRFWNDICKVYLEFAKKLINYRETMLESIKTFKFPYDNIRAGQTEFMKTALQTLLNKEVLFVEAPTGTGKTISTLYPAVKGLLKDRYSKIFYLTAKTATRSVASKAINDMRSKGLVIRSIVLSAREKMCPYIIKCDSKYCPFAKDYYQRLKPALEEILTYDDITPEVVKKIASDYKICPHELMLDTLPYCSIVIGDYNHCFDPSSNIACTDEKYVVLVDEAHNMVSRGRDMFSSEFSTELLDRAIEDLKGINTTVDRRFSQLSHYFDVAKRCLYSLQSCFKITEKADEKKIMITDSWEGMREKPRTLYGLMWRLIHDMGETIDDLPKGVKRQTALEFYFEARRFLTILEHYYDESYITSIRKDGNHVVIRLECLDASEKLSKRICDVIPVIFFSATLSPYEYYKNILIGRHDDVARYLALPSPFPPENLEIMVDSKISTKYNQRAHTMPALVQRITDELKERRGNYMVFFPSFEYLNNTRPLLEKIFGEYTKEDGIERQIICQVPEMREFEKQEFLMKFNEPAEGTLLGMAVLGGHFGEGIDLVGDMLSGVIIVGVGIPKLTPEREILKDYYSEKFGDGYAFAYRFPGWEKVLQAVGRVIRTEDDTGFALLIDERLSKPEYVMLFPEHWKI